MENIEDIKKRFGIIGHTPAIEEAIRLALQVAPSDARVLILGESGVGKDNISKIIHQNSKAKHGEYIAVNCGAIPEGTIDSELFGHEKGAFTDARDQRRGYFEVANNGTIFLDEVAELPLGTQSRLLRVLENGEYMRVGSSQVLKTNARVVAATNVSLRERVEAGKFRADLYYRLNGVTIYVPALRERKEDILLLFTKFATDYALKNHCPQIQLAEDAKDLLKNYDWPGNVRELKNITEQISTLEMERMISYDVLSKYIYRRDFPSLPMKVEQKVAENQQENLNRELIYTLWSDVKRELADLRAIVNRLVEEKNGANTKTVTLPNLEAVAETLDNVEYQLQDTVEYVHPNEAPAETTLPVTNDGNGAEQNLSLSDSEEDMIRKCLEKHQQNRKAAAAELGVSERTLYRKIKEFGI